MKTFVKRLFAIASLHDRRHLSDGSGTIDWIHSVLPHLRYLFHALLHLAPRHARTSPAMDLSSHTKLERRQLEELCGKRWRHSQFMNRSQATSANFHNALPEIVLHTQSFHARNAGNHTNVKSKDEIMFTMRTHCVIRSFGPQPPPTVRLLSASTPFHTRRTGATKKSSQREMGRGTTRDFFVCQSHPRAGLASFFDGRGSGPMGAMASLASSLASTRRLHRASKSMP